MGELDLDAIRARAEAATPGPWTADTNEPFGPELQGIFAPGSRRYIVKADIDYAEDEDIPDAVVTADAEFIAHARADIPELLAEVERLESEIATQARLLVGRDVGDEASMLLAALHDSNAERDVLRGQRDAVLAIHWRDEDGDCDECYPNNRHWPCATVRALGVTE